MIKNHDLVIAVKQEATARIEKTLKEIWLLKTLITSYDPDKQLVLQRLDDDLVKHKELMNILTSHFNDKMSWALKTNKLAELFNCAKDLVSAGFDGEEIYSIRTSAPNCMQTALLTVLSIHNVNKKIDQIEQLKELNIYDPKISPTVQTAMMPVEFTSEFIPQHMRDWFYIMEDPDTHNLELLVPTLGYAFGGSRDDNKYHDKVFRNEDCSSAVAKWVNSTYAFSTYHMKQAHDGNCDNDVICAEILNIMHPVYEYIAGDIFVMRKGNGGHTGVITEIHGDCFEHLSYNRDMPFKEGLWFTLECLADDPEKEYIYLRLNDETTKLHDEI